MTSMFMQWNEQIKFLGESYFQNGRQGEMDES